MRFKYSLENLRGLAILFVVLSHFSSFHALGSAGQYVYFIITEATSWFVFLSGYLFYHIEGKRFRYADYLLKKLKYVILPYFILSIPAILAGMYLKQDQLLGLSKQAYIAWSLSVGGPVVGPMWFIPMITIFFILSPLFFAIAKTRAIYPLAVIGIIFTLFSFRPINNFNPFLAFLHFLGFYLLGIAFSAATPHIERIKATGKTLYVVLPAAAIFLISLVLTEGFLNHYISYFERVGTFNDGQLGKLALLIVLFFLFDKYFDRPNKFLAYFAEISFGLFFMHGFFLFLFARLNYIYIPPTPLMNLAAEFVIVMIFSIITVFLVKLMFKKWSRYVIGC